MSRFLEDVRSQGQALRDLVAFYEGPGADRLAEWATRARAAGTLGVVGMGSSLFAGSVLRGQLAGGNGPAVEAFEASELVHYPRAPRDLYLLLSQSGESYETVAFAAAGPARGRAVAITNDEGSALARSAELVLPLCAGDEYGVACKTYANAVALVHLVGEALLRPEALQAAFAELRRLADALETPPVDAIATAAELLGEAESLVCVSRGPGLVAAAQCALTFMEAVRIPALTLSGGAFRHGPFEIAEPGRAVLLFAPRGPGHALLLGMAAELVGLGCRVVVFADAESAPVPGAQIPVPATDEGLFPLAASVAHGLLLDEVSTARGLPPGDYRHGSKVTTTE